ncbi:MAG: hypothetical protein OQK82_00940 [Candidatus Pacearchaeota archaeon]|nr:hypothetical protein [Candidatus Pacearchaeota archaeon]
MKKINKKKFIYRIKEPFKRINTIKINQKDTPKSILINSEIYQNSLGRKNEK